MKTKQVRQKFRYCLECGLTMDDPVCPKHGKTYMNSYYQFRRFPRLSPEDEAALRAPRKPNEELWVRNRPVQGGLPRS
jgi:hypothetical protein